MDLNSEKEDRLLYWKRKAHAHGDVGGKAELGGRVKLLVASLLISVSLALECIVSEHQIKDGVQQVSKVSLTL